MPAPTVAVIDIGSNSIKSLVATRNADGRPVALHSQTIEARISAGISREHPVLSDEGMQRGLAAVEELLATARPFLPAQTVLVATSAVRDAANGAEFRARVLAATGHAIRILSGDEEANYIGRGLTTDPALTGWRDFYVFDLGGGSLECLSFKNHAIVQGLSLPLGCVRLTERFVADATAPVSAEAITAIQTHSRRLLDASGFRFDVPGSAAVFTGGSMTTTRALFGAEVGLPLQTASPEIPVSRIQALLTRVAALPLVERRQIPGMPGSRADVFPAALATVLTIAEAGRITRFHHSLYNLRWGLAATLLG